MPKGSLNVSLKGADDIFSTEESRQEQQREQVQQIPIGELFPFKNHPFKVLDDESILEDTAFLCRKDNDHFLILPSIYEKLDLDDWLLAHLFFYDKDGKRCIGVELSEDD